MAVGARDLFATGTPLPVIGDDKNMLLWGSAIVKKKGRVQMPVDGVMLFIAQSVGMYLITIALIKLVTVFTNVGEGTYLRRNLFLTFGVADLALAYLLYSHQAFFADFTGGGTLLPYVGLLSCEGLVFVMDATMRDRKTKKAK